MMDNSEKYVLSLLLFVVSLLSSTQIFAQKSVTIGSETLNNKSVLTLVTPTGDQGFILPVVEDRHAIDPGAAEKGMLVYESVTSNVYLWNGSEWINVTETGNLPLAQLDEIGDVSASAPTEGQILQFKAGVGWVASDISIVNTDDQIASEVTYDNSTSGLLASDVQGALDELSISPSGSLWSKKSDNVYYTKGNVGIGTTDPMGKLDVKIEAVDALRRGLMLSNNYNGSSSAYGIDLTVNGESEGSKIGSNIEIKNGLGGKIGQLINVDQQAVAPGYGQAITLTSNTTDQPSAGIYLTQSGTGTGDKYAVLSALAGEDSKNTGFYSAIQGGTAVGFHSLISNNIGNSTGVLSEISDNTSSISRGFHSKISEGGEKIGFDSEIVQDVDVLNSYGVRSNIINNNGLAAQYGIHSTITGEGEGDQFGVYANLPGAGLGRKYGLWSQIYGGAGEKTGVYSRVLQEGDELSYGFYSDIVNNSAQPAYGYYAKFDINALGDGGKTGAYFEVKGRGTSNLKGSDVDIESEGASTAIGNNVLLRGVSTGNKTGYSSRIIQGNSGKIGYSSSIVQNYPHAAYGFESTITDNSVGGSVGIKLNVVDNVADKGVAYGIISYGDSLNYFSGSLRVGYQLTGKKVQIGSWHFINAYGSPSDLLVYEGGTLKGGFDGYSGGYYNVSDKRLKQNIHGLGNVLSKVMQLRPSQYQFKENPSNNSEQIGFIAQEVKELFPELVEIMEDERFSDLHTLNYSGFSVVAIKAIQEQQEKIENQDKRIEKLETQVEELLKKLH